MVTDEERREVAKNLRERTNRPLGKSMQRMFSNTLGIYTPNNGWRNPETATAHWTDIVLYLAELIDRPTCNVESLGVGYVDAKCHTFRCETCKSEIDVHIGEEQDATAYARFCPYCGMEIER